MPTDVDLPAQPGAEDILLTFHGVGNPPPAVDRAERDFWWDERPFLLALDKILADEGKCPCAVLLTFDDGNASDLEIALPALLARGMTASFFVCAGRVGAPGYLDALAIRRLLSAGMRIGSHGMNHVDWRRIDDSELQVEVTDARHRLEDICGTRIDEVSIPFGSYDRRVLAKLRSEDYRHVYTSGGGTARHDAWLKPRNTLNCSWQETNVLQELAGRESYLGKLRRALGERYKALL